MPLRRTTVHELRLEDYADGVARLDLLVSSGTYVRAIAGARRSLPDASSYGRPFSVDEADPERIVSPEHALARLA
jgi:hypothetical protein